MSFRKLRKQVEELNKVMQIANIEEIIYILGDKKKMFFRNVLAGIGRGIGVGIGVTLITAIIIYFLQKIVLLNIPWIGNFVSDIVEIVQRKQY
ncbi:MAG: hypothetical protein IJ223_06405 [Clostridia bacterium]|nr:hypothetical protein [Clostridia bacterium]